MRTARETIYAALFAKFAGLKTAGTILTLSRRWKSWGDTPQEAQPAIYQMQTREEIIVHKGVPSLAKLSVDLFVYVTQQNEAAAYSTTLNPILDAIDAKLLPDNITSGECTLGGLVSRCRVTGAVEIYEGVNEGRQIVAIVPIEIFAD